MISLFDTLQRSKKSYSRVMEPVCQRWKLTRNELDVLLFLTNNPEFDRAADIVERRGIAKSHVSLAVQSLSGGGLLEQQPDPEDRRIVHLRLTERAQMIAREGQAAQKSYFTRVFRGMSAEELTLCQSILERICKNIEELDR